MAAVDAFSANEVLGLRHRRQAAVMSWCELAVVSLVALLLSTQVFFQTGALELLRSGYLIAGWLQYLAEALACGVAMWLGICAFGRLADPRGVARGLAVGGILFAAAFLAECLFLAVAQPAGFFPPLISIAGDAVRWSLWGGIVHLAHTHAQRHARAAMLLAVERVERERADQRRAEAALQLLQAQIQPHFLFNLLAHVRRLYGVGHDDGRHAVERLRSYLGEVLDAIGGTQTSVARELELVRAYLALVKVGLGERLSFEIDAAADVLAIRLPPLAVLTLAENAVKHGIAGRGQPGTVRVIARREGAGARIEVRDDGAGMASASGSGVGLANTKARLRAMYGEGASLSLDATPGRGAVAAIAIARA